MCVRRRRRWIGLVTLSMLNGGAGICVFLCGACILACAGAVTPRSAAATRTSRAAGEPLPPQLFVFFFSFFAGVNVVEGGENVRAPPSMDRSLTLSMLDGGAGVCVCLCACVHSCVRCCSYAMVGGGYLNTASGR